MSIGHHGHSRRIGDLSVFEGAGNRDGKTVQGAPDAAPITIDASVVAAADVAVSGHTLAAVPNTLDEVNGGDLATMRLRQARI